MTSRTAVRLLLLLVLGLPILQAVLSWVGGLLSAMGDATTAGVLDAVGTATRVTWLVCLVGLVIMLGIQSVAEPREG